MKTRTGNSKQQVSHYSCLSWRKNKTSYHLLTAMIYQRSMIKLRIKQIQILLKIFYHLFENCVQIFRIIIKSLQWTVKLFRTDFISYLIFIILYIYYNHPFLYFTFSILYLKFMEVAPKSTRRVSNVDEHRNKRMNKSAILVNKWEVELAQEIPRYVAGSHRSKKKTININKGLMHQGVRARAIHKILQVSIKKAFEIQQKSRKSQHLIRLKKSKQISKPYPRKVLNMLFRQNIKNYNPYVSVLSQLEGMSLVTNQKDRISKICYLGIARNYFQVRKYYQTPQYSRVGILIRTYMVDVMRDVLQKKMQNEPMTVFIKINPTALSFNPYERPKQLQQQISKKRYYEIIQGINRVIVDEYQKYKKGNFQFIHGSLTYSETLLYLFLGIIVICMLVWSNDSNQHILSYCAFFLILFVVAAGMAGSWAESNRNLDQVCAPQNINNRIQDRLRDYLKSVTNEALTWRLGPDFYWIQIQNVKVRKRKNQASPDNF